MFIRVWWGLLGFGGLGVQGLGVSGFRVWGSGGLGVSGFRGPGFIAFWDWAQDFGSNVPSCEAQNFVCCTSIQLKLPWTPSVV